VFAFSTKKAGLGPGRYSKSFAPVCWKAKLGKIELVLDFCSRGGFNGLGDDGFAPERPSKIPSQGYSQMQEEMNSKLQYGIVNFERRRSPRFSVDLPIEYSCLDSCSRITGRTGNASDGGLMLFLGEPVGVGANLRIRVFFPSEANLNSIEVRAEVVWSEIAFGKEKDHRCGVRFTEIASEDLSKLKSFLDHLSTIRPVFRIPSDLQRHSKP